MKITFTNPAVPKTGAIVVGVMEGRKLTASAQAVDEACGGQIVRAIKASTFKGSKNHALSIVAKTDEEFQGIFAHLRHHRPAWPPARQGQHLGGR